MNRRWFLGSVGSVLGMAITPVVVGKMAQVQIVDPKVITEDNPCVLLHQMGWRRPLDNEPGYATGCIWENLHGDGILLNVGNSYKSKWMVPPGDRQKFLRMALEQRLAAREQIQISRDWESELEG